MLILGIESSCDETAAAVVRDGREILSSVISSQIELHRPFGGVFPELAAREHLEKIQPVVEEAIERAGVSFDAIDAIAVTQGPGLIGSLLVGVSYAKALAVGLGKPLVAVNHIEGHVYSIAFDNPPVEYPALALIVSGGHTNLFYMPEEGRYKVVSRTRDDAAGEAFDKVAKMLGTFISGRSGDRKDRKRRRCVEDKISDREDFRRASGLQFQRLKTAVSRYVREHEVAPATSDDEVSAEIKDIAASFQSTVVRSLMINVGKLADELQPKTLIVAGGVACNLALREAAGDFASKLGIPIYFPSRHLSTDNAAMIAAAGHFHMQRGELAELSMTADVTLRLQNIDNEDAQLRSKKVRYRL